MRANNVAAAQYVNIKTVNITDNKTGETIVKQVKVPLDLNPPQVNAAIPEIDIRTMVGQPDEFPNDVPMFNEMPNTETRPRKVSACIFHQYKPQN